jgi:hypothetical protein
MQCETEKHQLTIAELQKEVQLLLLARDAALEEIDKKNTEIENLAANLTHEQKMVDTLVRPEPASAC